MSVKQTNTPKFTPAAGVLYGFDTANTNQTNALKIDANGNLQSSDQSYATHASAYYQVTVTSTATSLGGASGLIGVAIPSWATMAFITPETGNIRTRSDGTAPTASVGQPIFQGQSWPIQGVASLAGCSLISQSGSVAVSIEFRG